MWRDSLDMEQVERTVSRAIAGLHADYELASRFLVSFMQLERELLEKSSFRRSGSFAISWDAVKRELQMTELNGLPEYLHPLCADAPKARGSDGVWQSQRQVLDPTLSNAIECLTRMRNNLAHGSKSEGAFDRNNELLNEGLKVLAYIDNKGIARRLVKN